MHSFRKLISLLLVAAMLFSLSCESFATYAESTWGDIDDEDDPAPAESGNVLTLPAALEVIEEEAFCGDESLEEVVIPYGATTIGPRAFAYSGLRRITIPDTVTEIADDAFEGTDGLTIVAPADSYAWEYAQRFGFTQVDKAAFEYAEASEELEHISEVPGLIKSFSELDCSFSEIDSVGISDPETLSLISEYNNCVRTVSAEVENVNNAIHEMQDAYTELERFTANVEYSVSASGYSIQGEGFSLTFGGDAYNSLNSRCELLSAAPLGDGSYEYTLKNEVGEIIYLTASENSFEASFQPHVLASSDTTRFAAPKDTAQNSSTAQSWHETLVNIASPISDSASVVFDGGSIIRNNLRWLQDLMGSLFEHGVISAEQAINLHNEVIPRNVQKIGKFLDATKPIQKVFSVVGAATSTYGYVNSMVRQNALNDMLHHHGHPTDAEKNYKESRDLVDELLKEADSGHKGYLSVMLLQGASVAAIPASIAWPPVGLTVSIVNLTVVNALEGKARKAYEKASAIDKIMHYKVSGVVLDEKTIGAVENVTVTCECAGHEPMEVVTDKNGSFLFEPLGPSVKLTFQKPGYNRNTIEFPANGGSLRRDYNEYDLFYITPDPDASFVSITGVVTDSKTGAALAGVKVTLDGSSTDYTGADGAYIFKNVPLGTHKLSFKKAYYNTLSANVTVSSTNSFKYNARMVPQADDEPISSDDFDPEFWAWCVKHYDQNKDSTLSREEFLAVTKIYLDGYRFSSLNGIRNFSNLTFLNCDRNQLTSLDLSGCSALTYLNCDNNQLTSLNLSGCSALTSLDCGHNELTSLNLSGCSALTSLHCSGNQLTSLNLSGCSALTILWCNNNQLTSLNLSGCSALAVLDCTQNQLTSLNLSGYSELTDLVCFFNKLTSLNLSGCSALTDLVCEHNKLTSLDLSGCSALTELNCYKNQLTSLNLSGCSALTELSCMECQLTSLDLSGCSALTSLSCRDNQLTSLDLSGCSALHYLGCDNNQLTSLNLSGCSALTTLYCRHNELTSLNLSGYSALTTLRCANNQLTSLNLSGCSALNDLDCRYNQLTTLDLSSCPRVYLYNSYLSYDSGVKIIR